MKTIFDVSYRKARVMALYLVLVLCFDLAQAQDIRWQQTNGPYGGDVKCFAQNGSTLFAGTDGGGVFRSTDNGTTWQKINDNQLAQTSALAASHAIVFAGIAGSEIFRSTNNGATWKEVAS
jgi:photosystem II stability/assembly factor-like uncharacterized protein